MPQSLAKIYVHLVFSTKHREPCLPDELKTDLHAYMGGTLNGLESIPVDINSEPDHIHALFLLSRTMSLSEIIGSLKTSSNNWLRSKSAHLAQFIGREVTALFRKPIGRERSPHLHSQPTRAP